MGHLLLPGLGGRVRHAQFLHDGSEIRPGTPPVNVTYNENLAITDICLLLPVVKPATEIPVIEILLTD